MAWKEQYNFKRYFIPCWQRGDETWSDQEARNDDAYALFGRLSSTRIPNKKEKKEFVLCKLILGRIVLLLDQINITKSWLSSYNLQGDKEQKSTFSLQMKEVDQSFLKEQKYFLFEKEAKLFVGWN